MATRIIFVAIYIGPAMPLFSFLNAAHIFFLIRYKALLQNHKDVRLHTALRHFFQNIGIYNVGLR